MPSAAQGGLGGWRGEGQVGSAYSDNSSSGQMNQFEFILLLRTVSLALRAAGTQLLALYYPSAIAAPVDRARSSHEPSV